MGKLKEYQYSLEDELARRSVRVGACNMNITKQDHQEIIKAYFQDHPEELQGFPENMFTEEELTNMSQSLRGVA